VRLLTFEHGPQRAVKNGNKSSPTLFLGFVFKIINNQIKLPLSMENTRKNTTTGVHASELRDLSNKRSKVERDVALVFPVH